MHVQQVRRYLEEYDDEPLQVRLNYFDLTDGDTTEAYFSEGQRCNFPSIYEFAAQALIAIENHMTGERTGACSESAWSTLEVLSCEPASWMQYYNPIVQPGEFLCFPNAQVLGFQPPMDLERELYLVPHFSGTEECFVTQNAEIYVLLYWHTTG